MIIERVIREHVEEAGFLWFLRQSALKSSLYDLSGLAGLDGRLEAHVDALRVTAKEAWPVCFGALQEDLQHALFPAAISAFFTQDDQAIRQILQKAEASSQLLPSVIGALGWLSWSEVGPQVHRLTKDQSTLTRLIGLSAAVCHRRDPEDLILAALFDSDDALRARALIACGEFGKEKYVRIAGQVLKDPSPSIGRIAAWATALRSSNLQALELLKDAVESSILTADRCLPVLIGRLGVAGANAWQATLTEQPRFLRLSCQVAGSIGDPAFIPWLFDQFQIPASARLAGEAFATITGVDLTETRLKRNTPEKVEVGPTDDPEDENVVMDSDEHLPWPDLKLVQAWWVKHKTDFVEGTRYLLGKPITIGWLQQVLRIGRQRHREAAALELALRQPDQPLFEVAAPAFRQQELLGLKSSPSSGQFRWVS